MFRNLNHLRLVETGRSAGWCRLINKILDEMQRRTLTVGPPFRLRDDGNQGFHLEINPKAGIQLGWNGTVMFHNLGGKIVTIAGAPMADVMIARDAGFVMYTAVITSPWPKGYEFIAVSDLNVGTHHVY